MRVLVVWLLLLLAFCGTLKPCSGAQRPDWAFFVPEINAAALPPAQSRSDAGLRHVTGSSQSFTQQQIFDVLNPPDWYPLEHPVMPVIVAHGAARAGKGPPVLPCALCHLPNGAGHAESATLTGLSAEYMIRQFADIRSGARHIKVGNSGSAEFLTHLKSNYGDDEIQSAVVYFAAIEPKAWVTVRETDRVPRSSVDPNSLMRITVPGGGTEAIGERIVELGESESGLRYRDAHAGYIAYVPRGSIAKGKMLIMTRRQGPGCARCHGVALNGLSGIPPLAGRLPTYIVRQLWNYQSGDRGGANAAPMTQVVAGMRVDEMLAIAAYLASLKPGRN
jgi:cytochrome c553